MLLCVDSVLLEISPFQWIVCGKMVICCVVNCSNRSGRDKEISFFRIPAIILHLSEQERQLTEKRQRGFLAAIGRKDLIGPKLGNARICSEHFVSGKPAALFDQCNPDWVPTLKLGS